MSTGDLNEDDLDDLVGRELDGRYVLEKFVDRGGFGAVYRGIDKKFNLPVAVKVGLSYREFMKEAKLAAEVRHDHIVQVTDYGNDHGLAFMVMEFLHGEDLEHLFKRQGHQLTIPQFRQFVKEVGDALAHAHADQLMHRDLKPKNIILKESSRRPQSAEATKKFVLLDFGIAAKLDAEGTKRNRTQDGAGTIEYMAPELLKVNPVPISQSEIYAFGALVYQMLAGRVPFPQSNVSHEALAEMVYSVLHLTPPKFSEVAPDRQIPEGVEELVLQCLEKDPTKRPQTIEEVRDRFLKLFHPPQDTQRYDFSGTLRPGDVGRLTGDYQTSSNTALPAVAPKQSLLWPMMFLVIGLGVAGFVGSKVWQANVSPYASLTMPNGSEMVPVEDDTVIDIFAGDSVTLTMAIDDLPRGVIPDFVVPTPGDGVQVEMRSGPVPGVSKSFVLSAGNLNSKPNKTSIVEFRATAPNSTPFEKKVSVRIHRPRPWLPESLVTLGFDESSDSRLCRLGQEVFATILERRVAGQTVRFRLVPMNDVGDRRIKTFYVMEQVVTNSLFNEFTKNVPDFELQQRSRNERVWEAADEWPATQIYVLEAQRFAQWIGGRFGSLPTTTEWEISASYYEFLRVLESKFHQPPWELTPDDLRDFRANDHLTTLDTDIWIGLGPTQNEVHDPNGTVIKNCSVYGCLFPRLKDGIQVTEMTSTVIDFANRESDLREICRHKIPSKDDQHLTGGQFEARLRGLKQQLTELSSRSDSSRTNEMQSQSEMSWVSRPEDGSHVKKVVELNDDAGTLSLLPDHIALDSYIGFRVVLLVDAERRKE